MITSPRLLQIAQLGQPILRAKAKPVSFPLALEIHELIADMMATVIDVDGVGLAAPQVNQSLRIFIMASHPNPRYPSAPLMEPTAIINPKILKHGKKVVKDWEGCLSIPGLRAKVPRWQHIEVEYFTVEGKKVKTKFSDFPARIFQHELDHLDGKVFLDRLEDTSEVVMEKVYQRLMAQG